jgi:hypothetical protein
MFRELIFVCITPVPFLCLPVDGRADDVQAKLMKVVDIDKSIKAPCIDVMQFLSDRFDLKIQVDADAFVAEKLEVPSKKSIALPLAPGVCIDTILRLELSQVNAVYEVRKDIIVIIPHTFQGMPRSFPPLTETQKRAQKEFLERLTKKRVEFPNVNAPITALLEMITHDQNLLIVLEPTQVGKLAGIKVNFPMGKYTLDEVLRLVVKGTDATYEVHADHVRIVLQP